MWRTLSITFSSLRRSNYKSRSRSVAARQQVGCDVLLALILLLGAYNNRTRRHSIFQLFRYRKLAMAADRSVRYTLSELPDFRKMSDRNARRRRKPVHL